MPKLTARKVETAPPGKYGDGGGLQFVVSPAKTRKWVFRYSVAGQGPRDGAWPVSGNRAGGSAGEGPGGTPTGPRRD